MNNNLYVLGSSGCLGSAVMRKLHDLQPKTIHRSEFDILSRESISGWVKQHSPCTVINCAVIHEWMCSTIYDVNVFGPVAMAQEMVSPKYKNTGNRFIHISSDYVGNVRTTNQNDILRRCVPVIEPLRYDNYSEVYSRSKYIVEAMLASIPVFDDLFRLYVIRVGGLFGKERSTGKLLPSFVERIVRWKRDPPNEDVVLFNKKDLMVSFADFVANGCIREAVTCPTNNNDFWYSVAQCGYMTSTSSLVEEIVGIMGEEDFIPAGVSEADPFVIRLEDKSGISRVALPVSLCLNESCRHGRGDSGLREFIRYLKGRELSLCQG